MRGVPEAFVKSGQARRPHPQTGLGRIERGEKIVHIADLTDQVGQPVDVLLSIQLGGGTDITRALQYAGQLTRQPGRTILVLVTDFYEGRPERDLVNQVKEMAQAGIRMIGLGALGYDARPEYNKTTASKCRKAGMDILSCTPEKLAEAMAHIIRG